MAKPGSRLKRDLSGAPVTRSDVNIAVINLRIIGASGMIENIMDWWERT